MDHKIKSPIGLYGKLPAHGDFIERNLSREFIDAWDNWLQQSILSSQSQLNEHWLNTYMVSPVWRFALSPGCLDQHPWIGITLPSVDSVGRYFPLTLAAKLPPNTPLFNALQTHQEWIDTIETIALACLDEQPQIDEVMSVLSEHPLCVNPVLSSTTQTTPMAYDSERVEGVHESSTDDYDPLYESLIANSVDASQLDIATVSAFNGQDTIPGHTGQQKSYNLDDTQTFDSEQLQSLLGIELEKQQNDTLSNKSNPLCINQFYSDDWAVTEVEAQKTGSHFDALGERMIDTLLAQKYASYSLWQTKGSEIVKPSLLCTPFLPRPSYFFAMMGGYWEQVEKT